MIFKAIFLMRSTRVVYKTLVYNTMVYYTTVFNTMLYKCKCIILWKEIPQRFDK